MAKAYTQIMVMMSVEEKEKFKQAAYASKYGSMNGYLKACIRLCISNYEKNNPTASQALQTKREEIQNMEKNIKG